MTKLYRARKAHLGTFALAALLAGCSGTSLTSGSTPSLQPPATLRQSAGRGSWMAPQAKQQRLVYVSSVLTNDVYAYSYSTHALVGTLTGFQTPYGLCVDKSGDVWVADDGVSQLVEYAHGGSSPIGTLSDTGDYPEGCAVDLTTGNLAVANFSSSSGNGNLAIYTGAKGSPRIYTDPDIVNYRFCGYDGKGNLFVDGVDSSSAFVLAELPKGSSTFTNIPLKQTIEWPGGVQWDGKHVAVGDTDAVTIYQIDPADGDVAGSTKLGGANYVDQFWINGSVRTRKAARKARVLAPSQDAGTLALYKYPAGGSALWSISVQEPFGVTVSN
jgi:DNA-binding beta-propeller fold protein YncE